MIQREDSRPPLPLRWPNPENTELRFAHQTVIEPRRDQSSARGTDPLGSPGTGCCSPTPSSPSQRRPHSSSISTAGSLHKAPAPWSPGRHMSILTNCRSRSTSPASPTQPPASPTHPIRARRDGHRSATVSPSRSPRPSCSPIWLVRPLRLDEVSVPRRASGHRRFRAPATHRSPRSNSCPSTHQDRRSFISNSTYPKHLARAYGHRPRPRHRHHDPFAEVSRPITRWTP